MMIIAGWHRGLPEFVDYVIPFFKKTQEKQRDGVLPTSSYDGFFGSGIGLYSVMEIIVFFLMQ